MVSLAVSLTVSLTVKNSQSNQSREKKSLQTHPLIAITLPPCQRCPLFCGARMRR